MQWSPLPNIRTFSSAPIDTLYPLIVILHILFLSASGDNGTFISIDFRLLHISYKCSYAIDDILWPVSFIQHVFKVHSCCYIYQYFIPFYNWIIFHYVDLPLIHSSTNGQLDCFCLLTIVSSAVMNNVQIFVWTPVLIFLVYVTRSNLVKKFMELICH